MSRATELAKEYGALYDDETELFVMDEQELEAFYHAARAEALREAAVFCEAQRSTEPAFYNWNRAITYCASELRTMADREGK